MSGDLDTGRLGSYWLRDALPGPDDPDVRRVRALVQSRLLGEERLPAKIDRFVLLGNIGEGGMGVVFAAFDPQLDRKVAIKLLRRGHDDDGRVVREAKAMAKLSHPNVAQVYEVGQHDERTFIAMEFVRGPTLRAWRDAARQHWRDIVARYAEAGRGLEAAHVVGLVHRDFKPDNAIVGEDGRVRVLDFGLARADESAVSVDTSRGAANGSATPSTGIAGTPAYMAPEQAAGASADAKSDQYSFCVSLWEALHGARPFEGVKAGVPAWLRGVLERGLATRPEDRFPSMAAVLAALADDPSRRRRRAFVIAGIAVAAAALVGAWALDRAAAIEACEADGATIAEVWGAATREPLREAILATKLGYAADSWERLDPQLTDYADRWATAREQSCIAMTVDGERSAELAERTEACLDERRDALASLVDVLSTSDPLPLERALPAAYSLPRLEPCSNDGWLLARPMLPPDEGVRELARELSRSEWLLETTRARDGVIDARALAARAEALAWEPLQARALMNLGAHESASLDHVKADAALHQAATLAIRTGAEEVALDAAIGMMLSANTRSALDEALWWAWLGESLLERATDPDPQRQVLLLGKLAAVHQGRRTFAEGDAAMVKALAVAERAFGTEHPLVAWVLARLAIMRGEQGKHPEAMALFERTLAIQERALGTSHPSLSQTLGGIGSTHFMHEDYAAAIPPFERALAISEAAHGLDHPNVAELLNVLASAYSATGEHERGSAARARSLAINERVYGRDSVGVATVLVNRGAVHSDRGELDEAMADFERALQIFEQAGEASRMDAGIVLGNIAELHDKRGESARALELFERAIPLVAGALGENHLRVAALIEQQGLAHEHAGEFARAAADAERVLAICSRADCRPEQQTKATAALARARASLD